MFPGHEILDMHTGQASLLGQADGAPGAQRCAAAVIDVGHDRNVHCRGDVARLCQQLGHSNQRVIGNAQHTGRGGKATKIDRLKPFGLDDTRSHHIVCAGRNQHTGVPQQLT